jgi:tRNA pseudouridine55 synthase
VDKPLEWTSHQVVAAVRKWSGQRRIGHAGTLDPLATGVLLLCLGKATRVSPYLMASTKVYRATVRLGLSTTTHDAEGEVTARQEVTASREQFEAALPAFLGQIQQVPPAYSAVKRQGKRLYEYARKGVEVEAPPRTVEIYDLSTVDWAPPDVILDVTCGPGTYVRALARDLGRALGCGASLAALRRLQSGQFSAKQAVPLSELENAFAQADAHADPRAAVRDRIRAHLHPLDRAFAHLPALHLDAEAARRLTMGQDIKARAEETHQPGLVPVDGHSRTYRDAQTSPHARAYGPGRQFLALVAWHAESHRWRPRKVFTQPDELVLL